MRGSYEAEERDVAKLVERMEGLVVGVRIAER
jgi:hypothetical protein